MNQKFSWGVGKTVLLTGIIWLVAVAGFGFVAKITWLTFKLGWNLI